MKKILRAHRLLVAIIFITVLSSSTYIVLHKNPSDKEFIFEAGFRNVPEFKDWEKNDTRKFWAGKGYNFLTYDEMNILCKSNGFIVAEPDKYIGEIPDSIKSIVRKNYKKLAKYELRYEIKTYDAGSETGAFCDKDLGWNLRGESRESNADQTFWPDRLGFWVKDNVLIEQGMSIDSEVWELVKTPINAGMKIVAHHSKFLPGTVSDTALLRLPPKPDPMIVMKQRKGWVVLAHWQ